MSAHCSLMKPARKQIPSFPCSHPCQDPDAPRILIPGRDAGREPLQIGDRELPAGGSLGLGFEGVWTRSSEQERTCFLAKKAGYVSRVSEWEKVGGR